MAVINGESITGIALILMGLLFLWAGAVNPAWATIIPADYFILAVGGGFLALGLKSLRKANRPHSEEHSTHHY